MHCKYVYKFENAIEIYEHCNGKRDSRGKRHQKQEVTDEERARVNRKKKERTCRMKLRNNFRENDVLATLTYAQELRPENMDEAKKDLEKALRVIRDEYKKKGLQLKYIRNIECGTRGAWHVHIVLNRCEGYDLILKKAWTKGKIQMQLLYEKGGFRKLAAYITKTPATDTRLKESHYWTSRNLPIPEPKVTELQQWRKPKVPKGWYIDPESMEEGINCRGFQYRSYTLLRTTNGNKGIHRGVVPVPETVKKKNRICDRDGDAKRPVDGGQDSGH